MKAKLCLFLFSFLLFFPLFSSAVFGQVVINEFSSSTSNDDWVEFYNSTDSSVDLSDYSLIDGSTSGNKKTFSCILSGKGFLIVPWDDNLNNSGDIIRLKNFGGIIDCVAYGSGASQKCEGRQTVDIDSLVSGEFGTRTVDGNGIWIKATTSTKDGPNDGSSKNPDAICIVPTSIPTTTPIPNPTATPSSSPESPTNTPTQTPASYSNIYISEFLANPESGNEKVEIKNGNSFEVNLSDWQIDDIKDGGKDPKKFSATISASGLYVIDLNSASFLDNTGDDVRLLDFSGAEKDKKTYSSTTKGKSWSKDSDGNWCETESSFGENNPDCPASSSPDPTLTPTPTSQPNTPTPTPKPTAKLSPTPTPNPEVLGQEATESGLFLLGEATPSATPMQEESRQPKDLVPFIFIGLGVILIGAAFVPFLPKEKLNKFRSILKRGGGIIKPTEL